MNARNLNTEVLRDIFRIAARYIVAGALFHFGMRMALDLDGIRTGPVEWVTPLGEFSGAQYAGIWLGISPIFQTLGGLVEIVGGLLLLGRRTTTVGAMIGAGCFTNALMLHICFRPSPWVGDAVLLTLSSSLILLDRRVLINVLVLDRSTTPAPVVGTWETPFTRKVGVALKTVIVVYFAYASGVKTIGIKKDAEARSQLSGVYSVQWISPADAGLKSRWREAAIDWYAERLTVRTFDGTGTTFKIEPAGIEVPGSRHRVDHREDVAASAAPRGRLRLVAPRGAVSVLNYFRASPGNLMLTGDLDGGEISVELQRVSTSSLPLLKQGPPYFPQPR